MKLLFILVVSRAQRLDRSLRQLKVMVGQATELTHFMVSFISFPVSFRNSPGNGTGSD